MQAFSRIRRLLAALLLLSLVLTACTPTGPAGVATPTPTPSASPAQEPSPTPLPTPTPSPTPTPTPVPTPTPTPTPAPYALSFFMPTGDLHIEYTVQPEGGRREIFVEYVSKDETALQRRIIDSKGSPRVEVLTCEDGRLSRVFSKNKVGYTYSYISGRSDDAEVLLEEPLLMGHSWAVEGGTRTITDTNRILELPIGSFRAIEVTTEYDAGKKVIQYYVPYFGLLAEYHFEGGEKTLSIEAEKSEADKGFGQRICFYFAQPQGEAIRSVYRNVTVKPNASMGSRFMNQLRSVPTGYGLIALDGVSIRSIRLDSRGIHVDFSESLLTTISAIGRYSEGLLLTALANTFCDYYQTDRFYITVEGALYESPYRFFQEDEYLSPDYGNVKELQ